MLPNESTPIEQKNNNFSARINELSDTQSPENESFSRNYLNKNKHAKSSIVQKEINSFIYDENRVFNFAEKRINR